MSQAVIPKFEPPYPPQFPTDLPYDDGTNMDSAWHFVAIVLLKESVQWRFRDRKDYYAGGNMFIYFSERQARNRDFRGPDFFFVWDVDGTRSRDYWAIWKEDGKYPNVVMELLSPSTENIDLTIKKDVYEKTFHTPEYFCYSRESGKLQGWRIADGRYQPIPPNDKGWLWCEELGLWLGLWEGTYQNEQGIFPRFFDPDGKLVLTEHEDSTQKAQEATQKAQEATQKAQEKEAELARLKTWLAQQGLQPPQ